MRNCHFSPIILSFFKSFGTKIGHFWILPIPPLGLCGKGEGGRSGFTIGKGVKHPNPRFGGECSVHPHQRNGGGCSVPFQPNGGGGLSPQNFSGDFITSKSFYPNFGLKLKFCYYFSKKKFVLEQKNRSTN